MRKKLVGEVENKGKGRTVKRIGRNKWFAEEAANMRCGHVRLLIEIIHEGNLTLADLSLLLQGVVALNADSECRLCRKRYYGPPWNWED